MTPDEKVRAHCREVDRCNQRGGRMLSIVDLVEAGTLDREMAAYALAAIGDGASFMVGALRGGAGKTTVMGALLGLTPPGVRLAVADSMDAIGRGLSSPEPPRCYVCHEISAGRHYAYLWGEELRAYFRLADAGHVLATNLHADTFDQARGQVVDENGVPAEQFRRMNLALFLEVTRGRHGTRRRVVDLWESEGTEDHRRLMAGGRLACDRSRLVTADRAQRCRETIDGLLSCGARTTEEVRRWLVDLWPADGRVT